MTLTNYLEDPPTQEPVHCPLASFASHHTKKVVFADMINNPDDWELVDNDDCVMSSGEDFKDNINATAINKTVAYTNGTEVTLAGIALTYGGGPACGGT